eukprot:gnl/MRDRNA2_/MRDRNA2_19613_c0_seq1.p1 gnl/MRDRNA2_/MRDRNA2_19613_c0~~gnl/MRDRNA2_/MRDRNA2_19613_c0_seq1.p1  ORF type:complete len:534 (-),score=119.03 gnl/MRDRNA2_/MRDRNA2_19613_c0_seq1:483-2084(-)
MDAIDDGSLRQACQDLLEAWGLNQVAKQRIKGLKPNQLQTIIAEFQPDEGSDSQKNSAKFTIFLMSKGMLGGKAQPDRDKDKEEKVTQDNFAPQEPQESTGNEQVDDFCNRWGLDGKARSRIAALSPDEIDRVCFEFQPDPGTTNVNAKLFAFLKTNRLGESSRGKWHDQGSRPNIDALSQGTGGSDDPIGVFVARWGLDSGPEEMLRKADPGKQALAIRGFSPPAGTDNINAKFVNFFCSLREPCKFWATGNCAKGAGCPFPHVDPSGSNWDESSLAEKDMTEEITAFVARWGLDGGPEEMLRKADPVKQQMAIQGFKPRDGTENVNGIFVKFFCSLKLPCKFYAMGQCNKGRDCPFLHADKGGGKGMDYGWGGPGFDMSSGPTDQDMAQFAQIWSIDEAAMSFIMSMPPLVKSQLIMKFDPPSTTSNVSGQVISFAKSILKASKESGDKGKSMGKGWGMGKGGGMGKGMGKGGGMDMGGDPMMASMMKVMGRVMAMRAMGGGDMGGGGYSEKGGYGGGKGGKGKGKGRKSK